MVPAGEERAPKRSPQSGPQALPCFWPRASFPRAESAGVSVFGKHVVIPTWWVCFPQDVPGPPWCREQRGAGEETAVRPSRPSAVGPARIERTHLCGDTEMPRGAWKRDEVTLLAQATPLHCSRRDTWNVDPECPQEEGMGGGSPTSSQGQVRRTWKRTSQDRERSRRRAPESGLRPGDPSPAGMDHPGERAVRLLGSHPMCAHLAMDYGTDKPGALWVPAPRGQVPAWGHSFHGPERQRAQRAVARAPPAAPGKVPGGRAPAPCPPPPATLLVQTAELRAAGRERASLRPPDLPNDQ